MIAIADVMKTVSEPHSKKLAAIEMGTNTNSPREIIFLFTMESIREL